MTPVAGWREVDATAPKPVLPCRCGSLNWGWFKPERRWICADCGTYPRGVAGADSVRCRAAPSLDAGQGGCKLVMRSSRSTSARISSTRPSPVQMENPHDR